MPLRCLFAVAVLLQGCRGFIGKEHRWIGDTAWVEAFGDGTSVPQCVKDVLGELPGEGAHELVLLHASGQTLTGTFGDFVASADYFMSPGAAVARGLTPSAKQDMFLRNFRALSAGSKSVKDFHGAAAAMIDFEASKAKQGEGLTGSREAHKASLPLKELASKTDVAAMVADSPHLWGGGLRILVAFGLGSVAGTFDHLGADTALLAYEVGHALAQRYASDAAAMSSGSPKQRQQRKAALTKAFAVDAYATHSLTDCFSSGHIRVPFKELERLCGILSGKLVNKMHNEESAFGLNVKNARGDEWKAFGDATLFNPPSKDNQAHVVAATVASIAEISRSFEEGRVVAGSKSAMAAFQYVPQLAEGNPPALLVATSSGRFKYRKTSRDEAHRVEYGTISGAMGCARALVSNGATPPSCYFLKDNVKKNKDDPLYKHLDEVYVEAPGNCKRTRAKSWKRVLSLFSTCSSHQDCVSDTSNPCQGVCKCGTYRINQCKCVKPSGDTACWQLDEL